MPDLGGGIGGRYGRIDRADDLRAPAGDSAATHRRARFRRPGPPSAGRRLRDATARPRFALRRESLRRRIDGLACVARARLRLAAAWASGATWLTLIDPFTSVPGHLRTGLRNRFAELVAHDGRGVVFSSNS